MQYQRMPVASKALAPMLWLLASESNDGAITMSPEEIAFRLRMSEKDVISAIKPLIDNGFFIDDSNMLAECVQDATTEKRQSRDRDREEKEIEIYIPLDVEPKDFKEYLVIRKKHKKEWTERIEKRIREEGLKLGWELQRVIEYCIEKQWANFEASWVKDAPVNKNSNAALAQLFMSVRSDDVKQIT